MLKDQSENNDTPGLNENSNDEEQYQRLFKKIARDFVSRADLDELITTLIKKIVYSQQNQEELKEEDVNSSRIGSVMKAIEYRENLSLPKHQRRKYKDVIEDED